MSFGGVVALVAVCCSVILPAVNGEIGKKVRTPSQSPRTEAESAHHTTAQRSLQAVIYEAHSARSGLLAACRDTMASFL